MIQCPKCSNKLPDWAERCHFCQADVRAVPRPRGEADLAEVEPKTGSGLSQRMVWILYYCFAGWWILGGVLGIVGMVGASRAEGGSGLGALELASIGFTALRIVVGLGLIAQVELIRGYVNVIAGISLVIAFLGLIGSVFSIMLVGAYGVLFVLQNIFDMAVAGGMIWIIGETRTRAPDI